MIQRSRVQVIHNNAIPAGINVESSPIVPSGQTWQITRIIFADNAIDDGLSSGFQVDFGSGGTREILAAAYLLGNTLIVPINRTFTGDGSAVFRYIRENKSVSTKDMFLMIEGFKRIGDI